MGAIGDRVSQPTPEDIRRSRRHAGLTQAGAAQLVSAAVGKPYRTWQGYEVLQGLAGHRAMPLATWELFLLLTHQHPSFRLVARK